MSKPLRPNVCMLIFNKSGKLWMGERADSPGEWQFPQGGAEADLSLEDNVYREVEEELGLCRDSIEIARKLRATHSYEWDSPRIYSGTKYFGQTQTFWLVEFLGLDSEINIQTDHPEFVNWRWVSGREVHAVAHPRRIPGYLLPLREFEDFLMLRDTGLLE